MNGEIPSYYAVIPASVRYDKSLSANAKLLYGEITALCNQNGYCWASNAYFADLYGVSKISISNWIKQLIDNGHITSEMIYKEGTKEIVNRYIRIVYDPVKENFNTPIKENFKGNNTDLNNTSNTTSNNRSNIVELQIFADVVSYLNAKLDTNYRASSSKTKSLISARQREGFTLADFKTVIDKKSAQWGKDPKMSAYLRPETLFGTKFESYLSEKITMSAKDEYLDRCLNTNRRFGVELDPDLPF